MTRAALLDRARKHAENAYFCAKSWPEHAAISSARAELAAWHAARLPEAAPRDYSRSNAPKSLVVGGALGDALGYVVRRLV